MRALDTHLALLGAVPVAGRAGGAWRALPAHSGPVGDVASAFSSVWCVVCVPVSTLCPCVCVFVSVCRTVVCDVSVQTRDEVCVVS